ncbi:hypothetical protein [Mycobacterium sp. NPDC050853]|uniref:hypothetical protein n=1 Tax=Mycobacterium sp. NPDC050853 TaxID=3155160 RepID=UPI0033E4F052
MVGPVERNVNIVQEVVESVGSRVGRIIRIITQTVGEVGHELSGVVADGFEIAEANKRARADQERWDAKDLTEDEDEVAGSADEDDDDLEDHADLEDEAADDGEVVATVEEVTSELEGVAREDVSDQERV